MRVFLYVEREGERERQRERERQGEGETERERDAMGVYRVGFVDIGTLALIYFLLIDWWLVLSVIGVLYTPPPSGKGKATPLAPNVLFEVNCNLIHLVQIYYLKCNENLHCFFLFVITMNWPAKMT